MILRLHTAADGLTSLMDAAEGKHHAPPIRLSYDRESLRNWLRSEGGILKQIDDGIGDELWQLDNVLNNAP